ncbi:MAG: DNA-directed RNA polymerase subunit K [Nanoarchaeota archaeon]|nr:DNA-directed RNA polymerase subunit K [Nanoarchaeota archaeon]MBU1644057.1 DNA-directed RNA polymerase subunit K [Nanoarchaeota archaeon]MBU1977299.1 DNA-directed RNA polymerase subunit K [Nanoarchaeota archaeon]
MAKKQEKVKIESADSEQFEFTKYEKARMIGSRALQLSMGAPFLVKLSTVELEKIRYDPIEIALKEFKEGVLPITVTRPKAA